jgi:hypothetical protein
MVEHIVLLKFKEQLTEEKQQEVVNRLKDMKGKIPGIVNLEAGIDFSGRSKGFSIGAIIRFEDEAALENYGPHEVHQDFIKFIKENGHEDTLVVDFRLE